VHFRGVGVSACRVLFVNGKQRDDERDQEVLEEDRGDFDFGAKY
jgi:hypothetical protein